MANNSMESVIEVQTNRRGECPRFQLLTGHSEWRVRHADTGGQYCIFETVVPPNTGVPMHRHAQHEDFYVLEGELEVATVRGVRAVGKCPGWRLHPRSGECMARLSKFRLATNADTDGCTRRVRALF